MSRLYMTLLLSSWLASGCYGQPDAKEQMRQMVNSIENFNLHFPQEKVYLHLDNTGYFMGEKIWFKAYVIRDDKQNLSDLSGVLYVELVNPSGDVVQTKKLEVTNGETDGCIDLKDLLNKESPIIDPIHPISGLFPRYI